MKSLLLKLTSAEQEEWGQVSLLLLLGFFLGTFIATYDVGTNSLFIQKFDEQRDLPIAIVLSGILGIIFMSVYNYLLSRMDYEALAVSIFLLLALLVGSVSVMLNVTQHEYAIFAAFVLLAPATSMVIILFWGIFGRMFSYRAAKRISGGIDAGQTMATITAFFLLPFLEDIFGHVERFLLVSCLSMVASAIVVWLIARRYELYTEVGGKHAEEQASQSAIAKPQRYIWLMALFIGASIFAAKFVNYSFLSVTDLQFKNNEENLTSFISFFGGTAVICGFAIQAVLSDRIVETYGMKVSLIFIPIVLILFTIAAVFIGAFFDTDGQADDFIFFFVLMSLSKLFVDALRDALENPLFKGFFFPLDVRIRFKIQAFVEGLLKEIVGLLSGIVILLIGLWEHFDLYLFNFSFFIISAVWIVAGIWLYNEYRGQLTFTLAANKRKGNRRDASDRVVAELLLKNIRTAQNDYDFEISLNLLQKTNPFVFEQALMDLNKYRAEFKPIIIEKIHENRVFEAVPVLKNFAERPVSELQKRAGLIAEELESYRKEAFRMANLRRMAESPDPQERQQAADLIPVNFNEETAALLFRLLRDLDVTVRELAINATGKVRSKDLLPILIEQLGNILYEQEAIPAIAQYGDDALTALEVAFYKNGQTQKVMINIINIYAVIATEKAVHLLVKKMQHPDRRVSRAALDALNRVGWVATGAIRSFVNGLLEEEIGHNYRLQRVLSEIPEEEEEAEELRRALLEQVRDSFDDIYLLLYFLYDRDSLKLVRQNILAGTPDSIGYALELLDIFLEDSIKPRVMAILDDAPMREKVEKLNIYFPRLEYSYDQALLLLINGDYNVVNRWTKACAIQLLAGRVAAGKAEEGLLKRDILANFYHPDALIRQTAAWAIYLLDRPTFYQHLKQLSPEQAKELQQVILPAHEAPQLASTPHTLFERTRFLQQVLVFQGVHGLERSWIANHITEYTFEKGQDIDFFEDGEFMPMLVVRTGSIEILNAQGQLQQTMLMGEALNQLLNPHVIPAGGRLRAAGHDSTKVYVVDGDIFFELLTNNYQLIDRITENLYAFEDELN